MFLVFSPTRTTEKQKGANLSHPLQRHREAPFRGVRQAAPCGACSGGPRKRKFAVFCKDRSRATLNYVLMCVFGPDYILAPGGLLAPAAGIFAKSAPAARKYFAHEALPKPPPAEGSGPTNTVLARIPVGRVPSRGVWVAFRTRIPNSAFG